MVNYKYRFILGRKNVEYLVEIPVCWKDFKHLTGIHHLKDLPGLKVPSGIMYERILRGEITRDTLRISQFYKTETLDIEARIKALTSLDFF